MEMQTEQSIQKLHDFIVKAKAATYVGNGNHTDSSRNGSHDLAFQEGDFSYLDSYFGGTDFIGQEVVYQGIQPIWAMNYYGKIVVPEKIRAAEVGKIIKKSLSKLYENGRFLGNFQHTEGNAVYKDTNQGDVTSFSGKEWIVRDEMIVYELDYHGGLIKD